MIFLRGQSKGKEIIPYPSQSLASHQSPQKEQLEQTAAEQ